MSKARKATAKKKRKSAKPAASQTHEIELSISLRAVPSKTLAALFGVSRQSVDDWKNEGMPPGKKKGTSTLYDLFEVLPYLYKRWTAGRSQGESFNDPATQAKLARINAQAANMEIRNGIMRGEYISRKEVEENNIRKILSVKNGLMNLARMILPQLKSCDTPEEQKQIVDEAIETLLRTYSDGKPIPAEVSQ